MDTNSTKREWKPSAGMSRWEVVRGCAPSLRCARRVRSLCGAARRLPGSASIGDRYSVRAQAGRRPDRAARRHGADRHSVPAQRRQSRGSTTSWSTSAPGLALFDYDGDGWIDIYFLNGAPARCRTGRASAEGRALPQPGRLAICGRDGSGRVGRHAARPGCGCRRLRQRRGPGPVRQQLRTQRALPQSRRRDLHGCDAVGRGREW